MSAVLTPTAQSLVDRFATAAPHLPGSGVGWLADLRAAGIDRFAETGFPTTRNEAWHFTSLRSLDKLAYEPVAATAAPATLPEPIGAHRLVFVDGAFRPELSVIGSLVDGVELTSLAGLLESAPDRLAERLGRTATLDGHPLLGLNLAWFADGANLRVPRGTVLAEPVEIVFAASAGAEPRVWHPRLLIEVEEGAEATVVEHHVGPNGSPYFANVVAEIAVGSGARLHHYKLQREGRDAIHLATGTAHLGRDAVYDTFVLNLGGALARHEARHCLEGTGIECRVSGAYALSGSQHGDITTLIDHARPRCTSREVVKGVVGGTARAVFQGKIVVRPDAQKTDGYQLNRALLLSDRAEIDSKPELEIYADDVKCSHGATVGELDDAQLFYLRSRGIPLETARALLIGAFLDEAIDEIRVEAVRDRFRVEATARLREM